MKINRIIFSIPFVLGLTTAGAEVITRHTCLLKDGKCASEEDRSGKERVRNSAEDGSRQGENQPEEPKNSQYLNDVAAMKDSMRPRSQKSPREKKEIEEQRKRAEEDLLKPPLPVPGESPESFRRRHNPAPTTESVAKFEEMAKSVRADLESKDAFKLQQDLAVLFARVTRKNADEQKFIFEELAMTGMTTDDGIVKLPFTETPTGRMEVDIRSNLGMTFRNEVNRALVSQSTLGAACGKTPEARYACQDWNAQLSTAIDGMYVLDQLVSMDGGQMRPETDVLYASLQNTIRLGYGFAKGLAGGVHDLIHGAYQMINSPGEMVVALGKALSRYDDILPALANGGQKLYEELLTADPVRRGEILGRAVFEISTTILPVVKAVKLASISLIMRAGAYESLAQLAKNGKLGTLVSPFEMRAQFAAQHFGMRTEAIPDFVKWSAKYLDEADNSNLLITFARRVTPQRLEDLLAVQRTLGNSVSEAAHQYLVKQVVYENVIRETHPLATEEMIQIARDADRIEKAIATVGKVAAPAEGIPVTRSTKIFYEDKFDLVKRNAANTLFDGNEGGLYRSHRLTMPGEGGLYVVEGTGESAAKASRLELGEVNKDLTITETAIVHPKSQLVLDEDVLQKLELSMRRITGEDYRFPQMIGYFARRAGFDAIKSPSKFSELKINNILLFQPVK